MNRSKGRVRLTAFLTAAAMLLCILPLTAYAATEQNKAQLSVAVSSSNPAAGEVITVTVSIDNYRTMTPRIAAMLLSLRFDTGCFEYVSGSAACKLDINTNDITSVNYDGAYTVSCAYTYANAKKYLLPESNVEIFSFKLKVKAGVTSGTQAEFSFTDATLYNGKDTSRYTLIECKDPIIPSVTVWTSRPPILLNGSADNAGTYTESVVISFDASSASLVYEGREAATITSPYTCSLNGDYKVTLTSGGNQYSETFIVEKEILTISKRSGTFPATVLLGNELDLSSARITVNYADGTTAEVRCDDADVTVSGFDKDIAGQQTIQVKYKNKTLSHTVEVIDKSVSSVTVAAVISKTTYLYGEALDVTGGEILVVYEDGTREQVKLTLSMISGYSSEYIGQQKLSVKYGSYELPEAFTVTVISRDAVDSLIAKIDALDLQSITADDRDEIASLTADYNAMSALERAAVTNAAKLQSAVDILNSQLVSDTTIGINTDEINTNTSGTGTDDGGKSSGGNLKTVWIIVAVIVGLSVIAGIVYFLVVYFKNKKELDTDEYYDDDDDDDDGDNDLNYDDDLLNIDDDTEQEDDDDEKK